MTGQRRPSAFVGLVGVAVFTLAAFLPYAVTGTGDDPALVELGRPGVLDWSYLSTLVLLVTAAVAALLIHRGRAGALAAGVLMGAGLLLFLRVARVVFPAWTTSTPAGAGIALAGACGAIVGAGVAAGLGSTERADARPLAIVLGGAAIVASRFLPFAYTENPAGSVPAIDLAWSEIGRASRASGPPWGSQILWGLALVVAVIIISAVAAIRHRSFSAGAARAVGLGEFGLALASTIVIVGAGLRFGVATGLSAVGGAALVWGTRRSASPSRTADKGGYVK